MTRARRWSVALLVLAVVLGLVSVAARARTTDLERLHALADALALNPPAGYTYEMTLRGKIVESGAYRLPFDMERRTAGTPPEHVVNIGGGEYRRIGETGYVEAAGLRGLDALVALNQAGSALSGATRAVRSRSEKPFTWNWTFCGSDARRPGSAFVGRATERSGSVSSLTHLDVRGTGNIGRVRDRVVIRALGTPPAIEAPSPVVEPSPPSPAAPSFARAVPVPPRQGLERLVAPPPPPEPKCTVATQAGMGALEDAHELAAVVLAVAWALWRRDGRAATGADAVAAGGVALLVIAVSVAVFAAARSGEDREFRAYERDVKRDLRNARIDVTGSREPTVVVGQRSAHEFGDFYDDGRVELTPVENSRRDKPAYKTSFAELTTASRMTSGTRHLCGDTERAVARYRGDALEEVVLVGESSASKLRRLAPADLDGERDPAALRARLAAEPPIPPVLPFVREETFCPEPRIVALRDAAAGVPGALGVAALFGEVGGALLRDRRNKRPIADA